MDFIQSIRSSAHRKEFFPFLPTVPLQNTTSLPAGTALEVCNTVLTSVIWVINMTLERSRKYFHNFISE